MASFGDALSFMINLRERAIFVFFQSSIRLPTSERGNFTKALFRLKLPLFRLTQIWKRQNDTSKEISYLIVLDSPAVYHRQLSNFKLAFQSETSWREADTWYRQTSITYDPWSQRKLTTHLHRTGQIVDIGESSSCQFLIVETNLSVKGRWNALKITIPTERANESTFGLISEILKDYNIQVETGDHFHEARGGITPVWRWIDPQSQPGSSRFGGLADQDYIHLPFPVRYQLEVCISQGRLSEFTMTRNFVGRLVELEESKAKKLLEHIASHKVIYYDPMEIFDIQVVTGVTDSKIPAYCCYMRTARITPSTIYYNTPTVDISNRVIRRYIEHSDRFLRVRFTEEKPYSRIMPSFNNTSSDVFARIHQTMVNGITIGDRHYEFLAFGNSQFRENGAYFVAPLPDFSAAHIRAWMGEFSHIRNIARYAARLGQCFSTTRAMSGCPVQVKMRPDITRAGFCFSDGVGKISKFLATMATQELKIQKLNGEPPSAFQFRLGGCKGMLTVSSDPLPNEVHIRPSQHKFDSGSGGLEIVRWSQFSMATLNRQLVLVLSSLGIRDEVLRRKLDSMLQSFNTAMNNDVQAIDLLQKFVDPNQMTLSLAQMVRHGFGRTSEPFVTSMLMLWKAWHLKYLKEKAKIVIDQGANLLGVLDEIGVLQGHFHSSTIRAASCSTEEKLAALPEVFVQISSMENRSDTRIIEGPCILARNPSLHPGDIRVVRAVNRPELQHLVDVVVFPQTGDRDIPSMCSGGDLDGDDYLIIWDQELVPQEWFTRPMKYVSKKAPDLPRDVTVEDITSFFVSYMQTDCLPRIAHAHMAWADRLSNGIREDKCIRLAQMHSDAVDYNKTGRVTPMTRDLEPKTWPHFMEKKGRSSYHSTRILGQLYDAVKTTHFEPNTSMPFDSRILDCDLMPASESYMEFARQLKSEYDDAIRRIMAQYEISTEFEILSSFVLSHNSMSRDYKLHEHLGGLASAVRNGFRQQCFDRAGGRTIEYVAPLAVAMYRVTQQEMSNATKVREGRVRRGDEENSIDEDEGYETASSDRDTDLPLISLPWIFPEFLGRIATGQYERSKCEGKVSAAKGQNAGIFTHAQVKAIIAEMEGSAAVPSKTDQTEMSKPKSDNPVEVPAMESLSLQEHRCSAVDILGHPSSNDHLVEAMEKDITGGDSAAHVHDDDGEQEENVVHIVEEESDTKPSVLGKLLGILNGN